MLNKDQEVKRTAEPSAADRRSQRLPKMKQLTSSFVTLQEVLPSCLIPIVLCN